MIAPLGYPSFASPPELVDAARATGYDGCSTATNHALDRGEAGVAATIARLEANGMRHAGTARSADEAAAITVYDVNGVKVAHLAYTYGANGDPARTPWALKVIEPTRIRADAARARRSGADLVVVQLHWGTEYQHGPDERQRTWAQALVTSPDIDVLVGGHAHVVQPIGQLGGKYVVRGLGNQLSNQQQADQRDGLSVVLTAAPGPDGKYRVQGIRAVPTYVDLATHELHDVARTLDDPTLPADKRAEPTASYRRTAATVGATPGVTLSPATGI